MMVYYEWIAPRPPFLRAGVTLGRPPVREEAGRALAFLPRVSNATLSQTCGHRAPRCVALLVHPDLPSCFSCFVLFFSVRNLQAAPPHLSLPSVEGGLGQEEEARP